MSIKFIFRGKDNHFVKSNDWDNIAKINIVSSEFDKVVVNKINDWFNTDETQLKNRLTKIQTAIEKMKADNRSNNFISRFLKSYVSSSISNFDPIKVYKSILDNGIDKNPYWQ